MVQPLVKSATKNLKKVVPVLENPRVSNGHSLGCTPCSTQCGRSETSQTINSPPPPSTLVLFVSLQVLTTLSQPTPRPSSGQRSRAERSAVSQPRPCYIAHGGSRLKVQYQRAQLPLTPVSYQSSAVTTIPAVAAGVTGATASRALTALHIPETNQNHLFAASLIWPLPLPFYFLDSRFSLIKYFFPDSLTASSIEHKESHSKGHVSLDQRQKLP